MWIQMNTIYPFLKEEDDFLIMEISVTEKWKRKERNLPKMRVVFLDWEFADTGPLQVQKKYQL